MVSQGTGCSLIIIIIIVINDKNCIISQQNAVCNDEGSEMSAGEQAPDFGSLDSVFDLPFHLWLT